MVVLALASVIGCSSGAAKSLPPASATGAQSTSPTTSLAELRAAILARWTAAERASVAAAEDPSGPAALLLVDYFVDPALSTLKQQYAGLERNGMTTVGSLDLGQPRVVSVNATQAVVVTCATNSLHVIVKETGKPIPGRAGDATPTPNGIRATMVLTPSRVWKLARGDGQDGSCAGF
jgi:hypothetical protein